MTMAETTSPADRASSPVVHPPAPAGAMPAVPPMYWRVLRLSAVRPNGWQRALLVEGVLAVSVVLALADVASAWTIVILPVVSMAVVKAHDYVAQLLHPRRSYDAPPLRLGDIVVTAGIGLAIVMVRFVLRSSHSGNGRWLLIGAVIAVAAGASIFRGLRRERQANRAEG
jgi:hypothetical protein